MEITTNCILSVLLLFTACPTEAIQAGIDLFIRKEYKDILLESWKYCQKEKDLEIYGWCIMSSHVHMIVGTKERPLDKIIGEMKSFTSRSLRKAIEAHPGESRKECPPGQPFGRG